MPNKNTFQLRSKIKELYYGENDQPSIKKKWTFQIKSYQAIKEENLEKGT